MSAPAQQSIDIVRGDDDDKLITFSVDVVNFEEVWFTVRESWRLNEADDTGAIFQATIANGRLQPYSADTLLLLLPHAVTSGWAFDSYVHDVQVLTTTDKVITTQRGTVRMTPDTTATVA